MSVVMTWLLSATLKGSLVIAFALLLRALVRGRIASRWMHALLLIAVVRLLMPIAPEASFSIFNLAPRAELVAPAPIFFETAAPLPRQTVPLRVPLEAPARRLEPMVMALLAAWASGCAFVLLRALVRSRALRRLLRDRVEIALPLIDECRASLGVRRRVRAFETAAVATPSLHGWLRPMLLLPRGFTESFSQEQLRFVLLHELAHLRRADVLVNWLTTFAQALHWFNPLVHLAAARIAEERELACDALALERLRADERSAYGGTVLAVLDRMRQPSPAPGLVGMTATHQQLKRRIMMIAAYRPQRRSSFLFAALVAVIALASLTDAVAGEQMFHRRIAEPLSPAAEGVMRQLETNVHAQLTRASVHDIANLVTQRTGVMVTFAEGALGDAAAKTTFNLNATNVPAHIILAETFDSLGLALHFRDTGVVADKLPEGARERFHIRMPAPGREAIIERAPAAADGERDVIVLERRAAGARELPAPPEGEAGLPRVRMFEATNEAAEDGVVRRRVSFRGSREGQTEGTLELEVHREATSH